MGPREENLPIFDESDRRLFEIGRKREQRAELLQRLVLPKIKPYRWCPGILE
jgi:hypothetical protein